MKNIKVIIFDLDNTLEKWFSAELDTEIIMFERIAKKFKLDINKTRRAFNESKGSLYHGKLPKDHDRYYWFLGMFQRLGKNVSAQYLRRLTRSYWNEINKRVCLFPGVVPLLKRLRRKYKIVLLSDSDGRLEYKMERIKLLGLLNMFDLIITSDHTDFNKPDKRIFEHILKFFDVKPQECVMVGDDVHSDLLGAKKVGMKTIWSKQGLHIGFKSRYADHEVKDVRKVVNVLNG